MDLLQWFINSSIKNFIKSKRIPNRELVEELNKPIFRKRRKTKVYSPFIDKIYDGALADMQLISEFHKGFRFLSCLIDIYSKYACDILLKDKKVITITNALQIILDE